MQGRVLATTTRIPTGHLEYSPADAVTLDSRLPGRVHTPSRLSLAI